MPRRTSVTMKLALMVVTLLILSGLGYWTLQREVTEIQLTLERSGDASHAMLRSAYEMEILVAEISAVIRRVMVGRVATLKFDLVQQGKTFDELLRGFRANTKVVETGVLADEAELRIAAYLEQAAMVGRVQETLVARLSRLSRAVETLDDTVAALAVDSVAGEAFVASTRESAIELVEAGRRFVLSGELQDAWRVDRAAIRFDATLTSLAEAPADGSTVPTLVNITASFAELKSAANASEDGRLEFDAAVATAFDRRDNVQNLIHENLQSAADSEVQQARRDVDLQIKNARRRLSALLLFSTVLGFSVTFSLARSIGGPIRNVVGALRALRSGNFKERLLVTSNDEFSDMALAFNKTAEELQRLTVTRAFLDDIQRSLADGVFVVDGDFKVQSLNRASMTLLDMAEADAEGQPLDRFLKFPGGEPWVPELRANSRIECTLTGASSVSRPVLCSLEPLSDEGPGNARYVCTITDITGLKEAEQAVVASREELRAAYVALQRVQEKERHQLANEVHDEFGAVLTVMNSTLFLLRDAAAPLTTEGRSLVDQLHDLIAQASQATDRIVDGLHPPILEHFGLAAALEWYVEQFEQWTGIQSSLIIHNEPVLDTEGEVAIFRVAQECLTNVARHAHARSVELSLSTSDGFLNLTIIDDGIGSSTYELNATDRHGLRGLRERLASLGGAIETESRSSGGGLCVRARLPLAGPLAPVRNAQAHG